MEKFINKETEGYVLSQLGQTTPQRLGDLETNVTNILNYLKETEQYTKDLEAYQESVIGEITKRLDEQKAVVSAQLSAKSLQLTFFQTQLFDLDRRIKVALISAYIALGATLGMGVALWLTK